MLPHVTRRGIRIILLVALVGIFAVVLSISIPVNNIDSQQRRNLESAKKHGVFLELLVRTEPRFAKVQFSPFTGDGGTLLVLHGLSEGDLQELKRIVSASKPPVPVFYMEFPKE